MNETTAIDAGTLRAYRETHYRVHGESGTILRIDVPCPALGLLHDRHGVDASAFVTAWNPRGERLSAAANACRQAALEGALAAEGLAFLRGTGQHPTGDWPGERSVLVFGLGRTAADALGRRLAQNALVWSGPDTVPRLRLLR